jgi:hypothetical protein
MRVVGLLLALLTVAAPTLAEEAKPKLGPDAVPMVQALDFLRETPAGDFWKLVQFYVPQQTSSACSVASVAMAVNFMRGVPGGADETLVTQAGLLEAVGDPEWARKGAEGGDGVLFEELVDTLRESLGAYGLSGLRIETFEPHDTGSAALARLREILAANEAGDRDVVLVYFNQGVLTGDWDGPHISPVGAYDAKAERVLVLDVDREWYVPYWSSDVKLLEAMLRPAPPEHGPLAGETGGLVWVRPAAD